IAMQRAGLGLACEKQHCVILRRITWRGIAGGNMKLIRTVFEAVEALGGDTAVAQWTCMTQGAIASWKQRKEIPPGWHLRLLVRLLMEGFEVDPHLFGLTSREAAFLRRLQRPAFETASLS